MRPASFHEGEAGRPHFSSVVSVWQESRRKADTIMIPVIFYFLCVVLRKLDEIPVCRS